MKAAKQLWRHSGHLTATIVCRFLLDAKRMPHVDVTLRNTIAFVRVRDFILTFGMRWPWVHRSCFIATRVGVLEHYFEHILRERMTGKYSWWFIISSWNFRYCWLLHIILSLKLHSRGVKGSTGYHNQGTSSSFLLPCNRLDFLHPSQKEEVKRQRAQYAKITQRVGDPVWIEREVDPILKSVPQS